MLTSYKARKKEIERLEAEIDTLMDSMEVAWGVIANAHGGNWSLASRDWLEAAECYRDEHWNPALKRNHPEIFEETA